MPGFPSDRTDFRVNKPAPVADQLLRFLLQRLNSTLQHLQLERHNHPSHRRQASRRKPPKAGRPPPESSPPRSPTSCPPSTVLIAALRSNVAVSNPVPAPGARRARVLRRAQGHRAPVRPQRRMHFADRHNLVSAVGEKHRLCRQITVSVVRVRDLNMPRGLIVEAVKVCPVPEPLAEIGTYSPRSSSSGTSL